MSDDHENELSDASIVWLPSRTVAKALLRVATLGALRQLAENVCPDPTCEGCRENAISAAQAVQLLPGASDAVLTFFVREHEDGKNTIELHIRDRAVLRRPSAHSIARMISDIEARANKGPGVIKVVWGNTHNDNNTQGE